MVKILSRFEIYIPKSTDDLSYYTLARKNNSGSGGGDYPHIFKALEFKQLSLIIIALLGNNKDFHDGFWASWTTFLFEPPTSRVVIYLLYYKSAAIRIGNDIMEFSGDHEFWRNGVLGSDNSELPTQPLAMAFLFTDIPLSRRRARPTSII